MGTRKCTAQILIKVRIETQLLAALCSKPVVRLVGTNLMKINNYYAQYLFIVINAKVTLQIWKFVGPETLQTLSDGLVEPHFKHSKFVYYSMYYSICEPNPRQTNEYSLTKLKILTKNLNRTKNATAIVYAKQCGCMAWTE